MQYSNRTTESLRTYHNISLMPEGSNQPDINIAQWLHDTTTLNDYQREIGNLGTWEQLYFRLRDGHAVQDAKLIDGFLYIHKGFTWQLIIATGLQLKSMSVQNFFIEQSDDNPVHGGFDKTYQNRTDKYHWKDFYSDIEEFLESSEICQATKALTQKTVGLLTPLTVPQSLCIEIGMDSIFLKQFVVDCAKLMPVLKCSDQQKPHFVTLCKVLNIIDRNLGYTYIIHCNGEINAAGVIDGFEKHIEPSIGLPFSIVSNRDGLFVSAECQDWMIKNGIRHKVSTTYYLETDDETERKNRELPEMFAACELEGADWLTVAH